jgi:hypothetical protein
MSPKRPPAALRILPKVQLLPAIRALPETVSDIIATRPELIRGSLGYNNKLIGINEDQRKHRDRLLSRCRTMRVYLERAIASRNPRAGAGDHLRRGILLAVERIASFGLPAAS